MAPVPLHPVVTSALASARAGRATLTQLAAACELAERTGPSAELGELREHLRRMVPGPAARSETRGFLLGVASGLFTQYLLHEIATRGK